jgi:glycosyltransferase involved in cell wall biosynthesis
LYNTIDVTKLNPEPPQRDLRVELNLSPGTPLIGLLATVQELKGQFEFVEAAARVRQVIPDAHFVFAGYNPYPGTYLKKVCERIEQLHAGDYIHYLGYRLDSVDVMKSLNVYVLASKLETMGLVLLEAMACGKPVVATRCGGTTEVVIDKETGLLVDVGNAEQLADATIDLLSRPDRGASLGVRGRERVVTVFDQRKCLNSLPNIYQEVLSRTRDDHLIHDWIRIGPHLVSRFLKLCTQGPRIYDRVRCLYRKLGAPFPARNRSD